MDKTGNLNGEQVSSRISPEDLEKIISGLHIQDLEQSEVDRLTNTVLALMRRPAEETVPGWEPDPPLPSDNQTQLGAGAQLVDVVLPILGVDWFFTELLPRVEEWAGALYRGRALELMRQAAADPIGFTLGMIATILRRPKNDRVKVSFYTFFAETFGAYCTLASDGSAFELRSQWVAILPGNQIQNAVDKLVETNRRNFTEWWDGLPTTLRYLITSMRTATMLSIEKLSGQLSRSIYEMMQETSVEHLLNGGHAGTGTAGSGAWPEAGQTPIFSSEA